MSEYKNYSINIFKLQMENQSLNLQFVREQILSGVFKIIPKRKGRSDIWNIFGEIKKDDGMVIENKVCCRHCTKIYNFDGKQTTNLLRHKCYSGLKKSGQTATPLIKLDDEINMLTVDACATWAIEDCQPFASVDGTGFKKMINVFIRIGAQFGEGINVNEIIPHSSTVSESIDCTALKHKQILKCEIQSILSEGAAITSNLWTDNFSNRNYLSAILHYITDENVHEVVLGIKSMDFEKSTGSNIFHKMKSILEEYGIYDLKNIIFVTNRSTNMISAFKTHVRLNCSNHLLNNVLEDAFSNTTELNDLISDCNKLFKYFKKANLQYILPKMLKPHRITRWNMHLSMFESIYSNWNQISGVLEKENVEKKFINIDPVLLKNLIEMYKNFEMTSKKIQDSQFITLHYVYPSIQYLQKNCQPNADDQEIIKIFKKNILDGINNKWLPNLTVYHQVAFFLYPPTNQMKMFDEECILEVKQFCIQQMLNRASIQSDSKPLEFIQPASMNCSSDELFFSGLINDAQNTTVEDRIRNEVDKYSHLKIDYQPNFNVLKWWSDHATEYPNLFYLCKKILCIPAGSAAPEQLFSKARNILTQKTNELYPKTVSNLLVVNSIKKNS